MSQRIETPFAGSPFELMTPPPSPFSKIKDFKTSDVAANRFQSVEHSEPETFLSHSVHALDRTQWTPRLAEFQKSLNKTIFCLGGHLNALPLLPSYSQEAFPDILKACQEKHDIISESVNVSFEQFNEFDVVLNAQVKFYQREKQDIQEMWQAEPSVTGKITFGTWEYTHSIQKRKDEIEKELAPSAEVELRPNVLQNELLQKTSKILARLTGLKEELTVLKRSYDKFPSKGEAFLDYKRFVKEFDYERFLKEFNNGKEIDKNHQPGIIESIKKIESEVAADLLLSPILAERWKAIKERQVEFGNALQAFAIKHVEEEKKEPSNSYVSAQVFVDSRSKNWKEVADLMRKMAILKEYIKTALPSKMENVNKFYAHKFHLLLTKMDAVSKTKDSYLKLLDQNIVEAQNLIKTLNTHKAEITNLVNDIKRLTTPDTKNPNNLLGVIAFGTETKTT